MNFTEGGVCAAKGFTAGGVHCGIRRNQSKNDLAILMSETPAAAAAVYTQNLVKGAPNMVTKAHLQNGTAQIAICNSGIANTCNADGIEIAEKTCALLAAKFGVKAEDVIVASTGIIGQPLPMEPISNGIDMLYGHLTREGHTDAAKAIMTTDTVMKELAVEFTLDGKTCHVGGMCKGSGMIHPNMATMLCFMTSDVAISSALLQEALGEDVKGTFNMLSVDGDTSTNDMLSIMANGYAGNAVITEKNEDYDTFCAALHMVTEGLVKKLASDGEGASKLLTCKVSGAKDIQTARICAKSVICSSLVKAAMFGSDANWGRVLCALGYSGADIDVTKIAMSFASAKGEIPVCVNGSGIEFSEELAKEILLEKSVEILVDLNDGNQSACAWGCDLTYDYVKINGDYRS